MDKKSILMSYTPERKVDSWFNLGANTIIPETLMLTQGVIYRLTVPGSGQNDSLFYCDISYQSLAPIPWNAFSLVDPATGEISFGNNIIFPNLYKILDSVDFLAISTPVDQTFVPFTELENPNQVYIDDDELELILTEIGIPFLDYDQDLEYPKAKIISLAVKPALQEYFRKFPLIRTETYPLTTSMEFDLEMPTWADGVVRATVLQGLPTANGIMNPMLYFLNEAQFQNQGGFGTGGLTNSKGRNPYYANPMGMAAAALQRAATQGSLNYFTRAHVQIERDPKGKKRLTGYCNKLGILNVDYAYFSNDWRDVDYNRLTEVRKLATARALRLFGSLRGLIKQDVVTLNYDQMLQRATELEREVHDFWDTIPAVVVIRSAFG